MAGFKVVLAFLGLALVSAAATDVVTLTDDTFDDFIESNKYVLAEFYAPWCGHCKKLAPEYAKAATALVGNDIKLVEVDATESKDVAQRFGVRGFPTLKWFVDGEASDYKGGRTADTIVQWCTKRTGPAAVLLEDADAVAALVGTADVVIVGFLGADDTKERKEFMRAAAADDEHVFGITDSVEAAEANEVTAPTVVLFKTFDEGKTDFEGQYNSGELDQWIAVASTPLITPFTMEAAQQLFSNPHGALAFLFAKDDVDGFRDVAEAFKDRMMFSTTDGSIDRLNSHCGVEAANIPVFTIVTLGQSMMKYPMDGEVTASSIKGHLDAYFNGDLTPHYKSDPVPESNDEPVTVIVGETFESIVLDDTKDVLLEVYAPWCGHCKKLIPVYDELGEFFKDDPNVVIAKMDGTTNEAEGLSIRGFPTLKFYPAGFSAGMDYSGERDFAGFKAFIAKEGKAERGTAGGEKDEL